MNLSLVLDMAAQGFGDRMLVGRRASALSASQLRRLCTGGAAVIDERGVDALVYLDVNGPCYPVAMFSAAYAGVPLVPVNYRLSAEQLQRMLARHQGAIAIADPRWKSLLQTLSIPALTVGEWLAAANARQDDTAPAKEGEPAVVVYTSGTTAEPKGVLLRHDNLLNYVLGTVDFGSAGEDETSLVSVPPYHIAAVANTITNLYAGRRQVVLEQFSGDEWLNTVRTEGVTHALVVPTMLARIMSTDSAKSVPSLRSLAYGGASMPAKVIEQALVAWPGVDFVNAYGLTETSSTIAVLGPDDHRAAMSADDPVQRARLASAGRPVPGVEIEIRGPDGKAVPAGVTGRIWVRGEQVSGEYAGIGSALDEGGFFDTRDQGYLDEERYLFIGGRADDTIIRGGENIAPAEVEDVILSHADVADVVVVGVPDTEWGQRLEACVVAKPGRVVDPEGLRAYVRGRLRGSKTPDRILLWDELPRTETGKIMRRQVLACIEQESSPLS